MQQDAVIAIVTNDKVSIYTQHVDVCVDQNDFPSRINSFQRIDAVNFHLVIDGGHGIANLGNGKPISLNDLGYQQVKTKVERLKELGYSFKSIHLTSCFSATFIPLFRDLLTDDGVIFCQTLSSTSNAQDLICHHEPDNKDYFAKWFTIFACKYLTQLHLANQARIFMSDAIYTREYETLHRFKVRDNIGEFNAHNFLIGAGRWDREHKGNLDTIQSFLGSYGISVDDTFTDDSNLEIRIRQICFPMPIRNITPHDISKIEILDKSVFPPNVSTLNLRDRFDQKYSWLIYQGDSPRDILSYIFVTKLNQNLFIHNLGTISTARGKGCAHRLLIQVFKQADEENLKVSLCVDADNSGAIRLYEKHGFSFDTNTKQQNRYMTRQPRTLYPARVNGGGTRANEKVSKSNAESVSYSFVLKALTVLAAVSLLAVAIVFLPELGIASTVGIISAGAYAITASSVALSVGGIGFFGYMVQHDCATSSDNQLAQNFS